MYFPPFLGITSFTIHFAKLKPDTKSKILLFTYGIIDAFCQGGKLSQEDFNDLCRKLDSYIEETIGEGILTFMSSEFYKKAFEDSKLLKIIDLGGKTYNDFASRDKVKGGQSITRLSLLVSSWEQS